MHTEPGPYGIPIFDNLDRYLPALLYDRRRFRSVQQVLDYVHQQAQFHLNPLTRREREWRQQQHRPNATPVAPAANDNETFVTALGNLLGTNAPANPLITVAQMDLTQLLGGGIDLTPVTVRPTQIQLDRATELEGSNIFAIEEGATCTICQETFRSIGSGPLRRIRHCDHTFHQNCIDTWFTSHVRCPVCRYDIREHGQ